MRFSYFIPPPRPTPRQGVLCLRYTTLQLNIKLDNKILNIHIQDVKFLHLCRYSNREYLKLIKDQYNKSEKKYSQAPLILWQGKVLKTKKIKIPSSPNDAISSFFSSETVKYAIISKRYLLIYGGKRKNILAIY